MLLIFLFSIADFMIFTKLSILESNFEVDLFFLKFINCFTFLPILLSIIPAEIEINLIFFFLFSLFKILDAKFSEFFEIE